MEAELMDEIEELEVTVVPNTVTEIIYLKNTKDDLIDENTVTSEVSLEDSTDLYEMGAVHFNLINEDDDFVIDESTDSVVLITSTSDDEVSKNVLICIINC